MNHIKAHYSWIHSKILWMRLYTFLYYSVCLRILTHILTLRLKHQDKWKMMDEAWMVWYLKQWYIISSLSQKGKWHGSIVIAITGLLLLNSRFGEIKDAVSFLANICRFKWDLSMEMLLDFKVVPLPDMLNLNYKPLEM